MFTHALLLISLLTSPTQPLSGAATQASTADLCALAQQTATRPADVLRDIVAIARVAERLPAAERAAAALAAIHVGLASGEPEYFERAQEQLERAEREYRGDPCFLYYRGVTRRELGTRGPFVAEVWARLRNRDNLELAIRDFRRAAMLRPDWLAPTAALTALSLRALPGKPGRRARWQGWAREALGAYTAAGGSDDGLALWHGRLLLEADSLDAALAAFDRYASTSGSILAQLERARTLFALYQPDPALEAYESAVAGLSTEDSALTVELARDIAPIFDPSEAEQWPALASGAERARWVRQFWSRRAGRNLVPDTQLIAQHYARLRHARKTYPRTSQAALSLTTQRVSGAGDDYLEDRGVAYVRLGEPQRILPCLANQTIHQSWIYIDDEGDPVALHFTPPRGADDWTVVTALPQSCYARLGSVEPYYNTLAFQLEGSDPLRALELRTRERNRSEAMASQAFTSDRQKLPIDHRLEFGYEWLFFRSPQTGEIEATLSYAIPVSKLDCKLTDSAVPCSLRVRASLFDRDTLVTWFQDEVELRQPLAKRDWIFGWLSANSLPGSWDYRIAAFEPGPADSDKLLRGNWASGSLAVPAFESLGDSAKIAVSSLLLARPEPGNWIRAGQALALNPLHSYPPNATVDLYYEIYGVPEDDSYVTELILIETDELPALSLDPPPEWIDGVLKRDRRALELRFEEGAGRDGQPWAARQKTLSLTRIDEGRYLLVLAITHTPSQQTVYRVTPLFVDKAAG